MLAKAALTDALRWLLRVVRKARQMPRPKPLPPLEDPFELTRRFSRPNLEVVESLSRKTILPPPRPKR